MRRALRTRGPAGPRRHEPGPGRAVANGLVVLGLLAVLAWIAIRAVGGLPLVDYYDLRVLVPDVGNLRAHSEVRIAGKRVGQVVETRVEDGRVLVELQLSPGTGPLPADTAAIVRGKGLIGARFVELRPGTATATLADGATLRGGEESITLGVPEFLDTFDAVTRRRFGSLFDGFGEGLLGRGRELNDMIGSLPGVERDLQGVAEAIVEREGAAGRFFPSLAEGLSAFDGARDDIARGFAPEARALRPFLDRRDAVRATFDQAWQTLEATPAGAGEGEKLLAAAADLADATRATLPAAPAALRSTTRMLTEAPGSLRHGAGLLRSAGPAVPATLRLLRSARPALRPLARAFDDLTPLVATLGERGCDFDNFVDNYRSLLGFGPRDAATGEIGQVNDARLTSVGQGVSGKPGQPDALVRRDPYPAPCSSLPTGNG